MTRTFLAFALALVSTSVVAACGSDDENGSGTAGNSNQTTSGAGATSGGDGGDDGDADGDSGPTGSGPTSTGSGGGSTSSSGGGGAPGTGGGSASGACTNAADQQILMSKDVEALVEKCASDNFGGEPATKNCIKDSTGLSDPCVTCFDDTVACTVANCIGDCIGGQTPACDACMETNCMPAFQTCSGLTE